MSRQLPYFKFFTSEWLNGNITLEDYELQGLFINVCAYYWHRDCEVSYDQLAKKFRTNNLTDLVPDFMQEDEDTGQITIKFLDEQFSEFTTRKKKLSEAGKKGAKRKKEIALIKPPLSHPLATKEEKEQDQKKEKKKKFSFRIALANLGVEDDINDDWLRVRKSKKLTNSKTAFDAIERELKKCNLLPNEAIKICVENSWGGFKNDWIKNLENGHQKNSGGNRATTTESKRQSFE